ncbi:MAG: nucleoside phosphorylase [Bacteroidales bacterium]
MEKYFQESELILNPDGSVYHLHLKPEHIAENVIVVGDQSRVESISKYFDNIELKVQSREFVTHTGEYKNKRITVISTGIGTDNIDIVINELDAAVNIDLERRVLKEHHTSLNIIRLGTTGAMQPWLKTDTFIASVYGLGLDGLLNFYEHKDEITHPEISQAFIKHTGWNDHLPYPYVVKASESLLNQYAQELNKGITATAPGFYGPQGRRLRIPLAFPELNNKMESFNFEGNAITNFEMETSALYGLGLILGHNTLTICNIIANRVNGTYSKNYKKSVDEMIRYVLEKV